MFGGLNLVSGLMGGSQAGGLMNMLSGGLMQPLKDISNILNQIFGKNQNQMTQIANKCCNHTNNQNSNQTQGSQGTASKPAEDLRKSLNAAERSYDGCNCKVKNAFSQIDKMDADLQREIKKLGDNPTKEQLEKVKKMAAALSDKIEDLKNEPGLEGNREVQNSLNKAERAANSIHKEVKGEIDKLNQPKSIDNLRTSLNEAERAYEGCDPAVHNSLREIDKMDAELQREYKKLGDNPSRAQLQKVQKMAAALSDKIEDLKNEPGLEGNDKVNQALDKAEKSANSVHRELQGKIDKAPWCGGDDDVIWNHNQNHNHHNFFCGLNK